MNHRFALVAVLVLVCCAQLRARPIYILPLGDSITQGGRRDREEYTYRYPLFGLLGEAGIQFDYIGSLKSGLHADATWPDYKGRRFDPDHEGHYGWKTAKVRDKLPEWIKSYPAAPDVVLIHLGTNDQKPRKGTTQLASEEEWSAYYRQTIIEPLRDIIATLRGVNPRVVVLVGHLNFSEGAAVRIRREVEQMAAELNTEDSPVVTVHHYEGFNADPKHEQADTFDWAHPNRRGQEKMAGKWFDALQPFLPRLKQAAGQPNGLFDQ
jgi:acyl-CoA thioesterase I